VRERRGRRKAGEQEQGPEQRAAPERPRAQAAKQHPGIDAESDTKRNVGRRDAAHQGPTVGNDLRHADNPAEAGSHGSHAREFDEERGRMHQPGAQQRRVHE
jgi:hypothetical protein